ncbi:hypothetical protein N7445_005377 [Penicillium cf. griseofulvum]
MSRY